MRIYTCSIIKNNSDVYTTFFNENILPYKLRNALKSKNILKLNYCIFMII